VKCLDYYLVANGITEENNAKEVAILLSNCGPAVYRIIRSLVDTETRKEIKYNNLFATLSACYDPKPSPINSAEVQVLQSDQAKGETICSSRNPQLQKILYEILNL